MGLRFLVWESKRKAEMTEMGKPWGAGCLGSELCMVLMLAAPWQMTGGWPWKAQGPAVQVSYQTGLQGLRRPPKLGEVPKGETAEPRSEGGIEVSQAKGAGRVS